MSSTPTSQNGAKRNFTPVTKTAIVVLLAFGGVTLFMMWELTADETYWTRALYLFGGVQAIAFAAAGYLFGTGVSREQINKAEEQAKDAKQDAQEAQQRATQAQQQTATAQTKARDIVAAVKAQATGGATAAQAYGALGASEQQPQAVQAALQQLAQTVEGIYQA